MTENRVNAKTKTSIKIYVLGVSDRTYVYSAQHTQHTYVLHTPIPHRGLWARLNKSADTPETAMLSGDMREIAVRGK
jgi:hypothetical protein